MVVIVNFKLNKFLKKQNSRRPIKNFLNKSCFFSSVLQHLLQLQYFTFIFVMVGKLKFCSKSFTYILINLTKLFNNINYEKKNKSKS